MSTVVAQGAVAVGLDGSEQSLVALDWAIETAQLEGRALHLVHAHGPRRSADEEAAAIIEAARARLSLRTVPGMDSRETGRLLVRRLATRPPRGARVTARLTGTAPWWTTDPEGPAFEAARRALKAGFGREAAMIGCGGSIGFVGPFARVLGGVPCLLTGVADPACNAHSENESLHLGDWVKCMRAAVHLYEELARVPVGRRRRR